MSAATPQHIMQLGLGFWASKTVLSAVELGVFSTLAAAPADLPTLQRKLALHQRSARDFLDALVALKLLERENGIYSNTADTALGDFQGRTGIPLFHFYKRVREQGSHSYAAMCISQSSGKGKRAMTKDDLKKGQRISPRNPKTGTEVPTSRVVVFKPSAILNQRINRHGPVTDA